MFKGRWGAGLYGDYVVGRYRLPNTWNAGVQLNYFADCTAASVVKKQDLKNEVGYCFDESRPYAVVYSPFSPPQQLSQLPPELGSKLPITRHAQGRVGERRHS